MLTAQELNEATLGHGWGWDPDDEILWIRASVGLDRPLSTAVQIVASFMIIGANGAVVGYPDREWYVDPEWYVEYDVRDAAGEPIHYAHIPLENADEQAVLSWLRQPASSAELHFADAIAAVRRAPNEIDGSVPESCRAAPVADDDEAVGPAPGKQVYTVAYRVTATVTYDLLASSPEGAYYAADQTDWKAGEVEVDEVHAVFVSFDRPTPDGGWRRVHLGEDELDLENHGREDELEAGNGEP